MVARISIPLIKTEPPTMLTFWEEEINRLDLTSSPTNEEEVTTGVLAPAVACVTARPVGSAEVAPGVLGAAVTVAVGPTVVTLVPVVLDAGVRGAEVPEVLGGEVAELGLRAVDAVEVLAAETAGVLGGTAEVAARVLVGAEVTMVVEGGTDGVRDVFKMTGESTLPAKRVKFTCCTMSSTQPVSASYTCSAICCRAYEAEKRPENRKYFTPRPPTPADSDPLPLASVLALAGRKSSPYPTRTDPLLSTAREPTNTTAVRLMDCSDRSPLMGVHGGAAESPH